MRTNWQKILGSSTIRPNISSWNVGVCVRLLHMLPSVGDPLEFFLWLFHFGLLRLYPCLCYCCSLYCCAFLNLDLAQAHR